MLGSLYLHSLSVHPHSVQCGLNYCVYYVYVMCCDSNKKKTGWTKNRTYTKRMSEKCLLFYLYTTHRSLTLSSDFCFACLACSFTHQFIVRIGIVCDTRLNITTVVLNIGWALNANFFFSLFRCNCNCSRIRYVIEQSVKSTSFFFCYIKIYACASHANTCSNGKTTVKIICQPIQILVFFTVSWCCCCWYVLTLALFTVRSLSVSMYLSRTTNRVPCVHSIFAQYYIYFAQNQLSQFEWFWYWWQFFFNFKGKRMNFLFFDS